ncbi:hypothetical protein AB3S75_046334 [Citrus x aurantiifolia]
MAASQNSQKYPTMPEVLDELKRMTDIGFPIAAMSLVNYLKNMVLVVCMGRLGSLELAGGALAIGFTNITGYSVLSGLAMGMEPLCGQGHEWGILIRLAIPSCMAVCLEWWWYEFMTILAGSSVSTRVGNELGAGRPEKARLATVVAIGLALLVSLFGLLGTTLGREAWGRVFTNDVQVLELTKTVLPIIGLCELANCPQTTSCGILRGSARPDWERETFKAANLVGKSNDDQTVKCDEEALIGFVKEAAFEK